MNVRHKAICTGIARESVATNRFTVSGETMRLQVIFDKGFVTFIEEVGGREKVTYLSAPIRAKTLTTRTLNILATMLALSTRDDQVSVGGTD